MAHPEIFSLDWWALLLAGISSLAIFSFLYRENPFYRFFEHLFIGIGTGYGIVATIRSFFWPLVLKPLLGLDLIRFPDGTYSERYDYNMLFYILPIAFGSLYYFILSKRHNWIAQLVIGLSLGCSGGIAFKGVLTEMLPQLEDSFKPLYVSGDIFATFSNIVFIITLVKAMTYFFFTFRRGESKAVAVTASVGRWMMMGCFGAFFGTTIMARMALLVERLDFLLNNWLQRLL
jgi:hypothetical protein